MPWSFVDDATCGPGNKEDVSSRKIWVRERQTPVGPPHQRLHISGIHQPQAETTSNRQLVQSTDAEPKDRGASVDAGSRGSPGTNPPPGWVPREDLDSSSEAFLSRQQPPASSLPLFPFRFQVSKTLVNHPGIPRRCAWQLMDTRNANSFVSLLNFHVSRTRGNWHKTQVLFFFSWKHS